ncbi:carboxypeptidase regulatory-like domain-containing protein [Stigmatella hybrida]|uniref:carboxypeptidase regulatory-like domain-containing protein n=1 Tax=Stigmatella hybrida TaxID=394097 RepID=UPI001CDB2E41|nr:carboxypeptidase regulatory-like domain-containing protein [Stigmatella hybrida]
MRRSSASWFWALVLALAACSPASQPSPSAGRITGQALLQEAASHEGITLTLPDAHLSTQTDAEGHFSFEEVPPGVHLVVATRARYGQAQQSVELQAGLTASVAFSLLRERGQVTGTFQLDDAATAEGITVTLAGTAFQAVTDAQGQFSFSGVPTGTYTLEGQKDLYASAQQPVEVRTDETASVSLALLRERGNVAGTLQLEGEGGPGGIAVALAETGASAATDAQGLFSFEGLPTGRYTLVIQKDLYTSVRHAVEVRAGQTTDVALTLARERGQVAGTVRLEGISQHGGITVVLKEARVSTETDAQGQFSFSGVPTGTYTLEGRKDLYTSVQQTVEVQADEAASVSLTLLRERGSVAGTVLLEGVSQHGGTLVRLKEAQVSIQTDAQGRFFLGRIPTGTYILELQKSLYASVQQTVEVRLGETTDVSLTLARERGGVAGVLQLEDASSPEGIAVTLASTGFSTLTGAQGQFSFEGVPTGTYTLVAQKDRFVTARHSVTVRANEQSSVTLTLPLSRGSVAGVLHPDDDASAKDIILTLTELAESAEADAQGRFTFDGLLPGTYTLRVQRDGYLPLQQSVVVLGEQTTSVSLTLARQRGTVAGTVQLTGESVHDGISVTLSGLSRSAVTDAQGHFVLEGVPTGTYTLTARKDHYTRAGQGLEVQWEQTATATLALERLGAPVLTAPALAVQGGHVALTGSGFGAQRGGSQVSLGGQSSLEYISWSDERVVVRVPHAFVPGTYTVTLTPGVSWRPSVSASFRVLPQQTLSTADDWGVGIRPGNTVTTWGGSYYKIPQIPAGLTGVVSVSAEYFAASALKDDGTVVQWGLIGDDSDSVPIPEGLQGVVAISSGLTCTLALKQDGTVTGWGNNYYKQLNIPPGLSGVVAIAAGWMHSLALKADGTVVTWGSGSSQVMTLPPGLSGVVAIATSSDSSLAIKADGTAVIWGYIPGAYGPWELTGLGDVVQAAGGSGHYTLLRANGSLLGWGTNDKGQAAPPASLTDVASVADRSSAFSIALRQNGQIAMWGQLPSSSERPPAGLVLRVPAR